MTKINWALAVVFAVAVLLVLGLGMVLLFGLFGGGYGGWGMMGPGMMGFGPFGWFGMMLMWLFPLGLLVVILLGIVWLIRSLWGTETTAKPAALACPDCRRHIEVGWKACPYCGHQLTVRGQAD